MRGKQLQAYSTHDLVQELKRRFAEVESAREFLLATGDGHSVQPRKRKQVTITDTHRGISSLTQKIRHAEARKPKSKEDTDNIKKWKADREKLRTQLPSRQ